MKKFNPRYESGIPLEKAVVNFLGKMGISNSHNNFTPSSYVNDNHNVVDIVLKERGQDKALIECTNPKETTFMNNRIMKSKMEYFHRKDPEHSYLWVLVVSFLTFSKEIMELIVKEGIQLVVLNKRVTKENIHRVIRGLFNSPLFTLLRPFSIKHREEPRKQEPTETKKTTLTKQIPSKSKVAKSIDSSHYLYQHQRLSKNLQVLRVIEFLAGNNGKGRPEKEPV